MSSLSLSQTINTENIRCYDENQITEIYKGLKQSDYLKTRLAKTEIALSNSEKKIAEQDQTIRRLNEDSRKNQDLLKNNSTQHLERQKELEQKIHTLNQEYNQYKQEVPREKRKTMRKGIGIGGVFGIIGGTIITLILTK